MTDIYCPLDTPSLETATKWAADLAGHVGGMKIGLEFFNAQGPQGVKAVTDMGMPLFLDLKFFDIPNTVAGAVRSVTPLAPYMLNVHASGGPAMMKAALEAAEQTSASLGIERPKVIAVTVLTSFDESDLESVGVSDSPQSPWGVRFPMRQMSAWPLPTRLSSSLGRRWHAHSTYRAPKV